MCQTSKLNEIYNLACSYTLFKLYSFSVQINSSAKLLAGKMHVSKRSSEVLFRALLNNDYRGVVNGLHDGSQATAQVVGLVHVDFGRVFKHYCLG